MLACRWTATSAGRHELIPDGCLDLLWIDGGGTWICGPDTRSWGFDLPPGTAMSGVRFRPGAAGAALRVDASELRDVRVALADLLGSGADRILSERLDGAAGSGQRLRVLEDFVRSRCGEHDPGSTAGLADLVASDPAYGVEQLAAATGVSSRQLRRRFNRGVGYGPAFFARIARLQRFARVAARSSGRGIAGLAASVGYVDQAHLAKDCRALAAMTPRQLIDVLPHTSVVVTVDAVPRVRSVQDHAAADQGRSAA